jgi:hypothetical protein
MRCQGPWCKIRIVRGEMSRPLILAEILAFVRLCRFLITSIVSVLTLRFYFDIDGNMFLHGRRRLYYFNIVVMRVRHTRVCGKKIISIREIVTVFFTTCTIALLHIMFIFMRPSPIVKSEDRPSSAWQCHLVALFDCWWTNKLMVIETCRLLDENGQCSQQLFFNIQLHMDLLRAKGSFYRKLQWENRCI